MVKLWAQPPKYNNFLLLYADKMLGKQKSFMFRQHYIKLIKLKKKIISKTKNKEQKNESVRIICACVSNKRYAYLRIERILHMYYKNTSNHKFFIN